MRITAEAIALRDIQAEVEALPPPNAEMGAVRWVFWDLDREIVKRFKERFGRAPTFEEQVQARRATRPAIGALDRG